MGSPNRYYKRALQAISHALAYDDDIKLAKELEIESSNERLEKYIVEKKHSCDEHYFYFNVGRTYEYVLTEADEEGCDAFNACIAGLNIFLKFIGLKNKRGDKNE